MGRIQGFVFLGTVLAATGTASAGAALSPEELFAKAGPRVLRLEVTRAPEPGVDAAVGAKVANGSAVVVGLEPTNAPRFVTFATAYHVMTRATSFVAYAPGRPEPVASSSAPGASAECFVDRSRELAFVRVAVDPAGAAGLVAVDIDKDAQLPASDGRLAVGPPGLAVGFSREGSVPLDAKRVSFLGLVSADQLGLVRRIRFSRAPGELVPGQMDFQLLGDQATLEGMSGGLVLGPDGAFAGLVHGRRTDEFNRIIPAIHLRDPWRRAREKLRRDGHWPTLSEARLEEPSLFSAEADATVVDRLDWGTLEGLTVLLGDDPLNAIDRFQEIVIVPPDRGKSPPDLEIYTLMSETTPTPEHSLEIWVNGEKSKIDPVTKKVVLKLRELPGETMVTVIKTSGKVNDYELSKLLMPSRVDLAFQYEGEEPFRRVVRSLPLIVQRYALFITVVNSPRVEPAPPPRPANTRLALRLDYAQAVLNQAPFVLEVSNRLLAAPTAGPGEAAFEAGFRLDRTEAWQLERMSEQRLGLTLIGRVDILGKALRYRDLIVRPGPGPDGIWPPQFRVTGRFQFPYEMPEPKIKAVTLGLTVSPRVTATRSSGAMRVDVGNGVQFDAAGVLRFLFSSYVNRTLIDDNNQPHRIADEKVAPFLHRLGFAAPGGWSPKIRRAALVRDPQTRRNWLVITFRIDPPAAAGVDPPPNVDLLAPPKGPAGRVLEVEAWGAPGKLVEHFPGLRDNPIFAAILNRLMVDHLNLSVDLSPQPAEWFKGLEPAKETRFLATAGREVAERIQAALAYSIGRADAINLSGDAAPR